MTSPEIANFIDQIHRSHLENSQNVYSVKRKGDGVPGRERSVSPLANFVFEYFIFNSLYSIDWFESFETGSLVEHSRNGDDFSESKQQRELVKFCRKQCKHLDCNVIAEAFCPLACLDHLDRKWTEIAPNSRMSVEQGKRFFSKIARLSNLAKSDDFKANKATFNLIDDCCYFVYLVRNSIFHGAKSIGEIYEQEQKLRIEVYDSFVRCLNSMFFLSCGKSTHVATLAKIPNPQIRQGK